MKKAIIIIVTLVVISGIIALIIRQRNKSANKQVKVDKIQQDIQRNDQLGKMADEATTAEELQAIKKRKIKG